MSAAPYVSDILPGLLEQSLCRNGKCIRHLSYDHCDVAGQPLLEPGVALFEHDFQHEVASDRPSAGEIHACDRADLFYLSAELPIRNRIEAYGDWLPFRQFPALGFVYAGSDSQRVCVRQFGNGCSRPCVISGPICAHA